MDCFNMLLQSMTLRAAGDTLHEFSVELSVTLLLEELYRNSLHMDLQISKA